LLAYASGTATNELVFSLAIAADNAATAVDDVLVVGADPVALASGTIKDLDGTVSTITSLAAIGTAAGSITVVT
jgi:hypothetical protein